MDLADKITGQPLTASDLGWILGQILRLDYKASRQAFQRAGWMSLGECADFDWMHWQRNPPP